MSYGLNTTNDGTVVMTLGKKLLKVIKIDLTKPVTEALYEIPCKEITFAVVGSEIYFYADQNTEDHKMTINEKVSLEAQIDRFYVTVPTGSSGILELWLWR